MPVNILKKHRVPGTLQTIQDRPIPIESHGVGDQQVVGLIDAAQRALIGIKSEEVRVALENVISSILIVRENKTQFDAIRRNIEILWNRDIEKAIARI